MINAFKRTDIEAVKNNLALQLIPISLNVIMLNHNNNHIYINKKLIEVIVLIFCNLVSYEEWVITLKWTCKMILL